MRAGGNSAFAFCLLVISEVQEAEREISEL